MIAPGPVVPASEMRYARSSCTMTTEPTRGKSERRASRRSGSRKFGRAGRKLLRINTVPAMTSTAIAPAAVPIAGPYPPAARPPIRAPAIVPALYTRPVTAVTPNFDRDAAALVQTVAIFRISGEPARGKEAPAVERRGPQRATNVERLSRKPATRPARTAGSDKTQVARKAVGDDSEWTEF